MEDDDDAQAAVSKNLKLAVANSYACNAILLEVVKDIARSKKSGALKYLDDLFDRVGHRLDSFDDREDTHTGQTAATRAVLSTFFAWAKEVVPVQRRRKARSPAVAKQRKRRIGQQRRR